VTRRSFGVAACALLAGAAWLPARAGPDEALAAFKAGRYLEAVAELQAVVDRTPGYSYGYFLLGHCLLKMGRTSDAEMEFRRALRIDAGRPEYYEGFALALSASGNWPLTVRVASDGLALAKDARTRYAFLAIRGYALAASRRWGEAVRDLEEAQRIQANPWILVFLGKARFASGDYENAVSPLRRVVQLAPDDPTVLRLLAECFLRLAADEQDAIRKRFDYLQSLAYAQRLAWVVPDDLDVVHLVGRAALGAGRLDQAENVFRHVLAVNPRQCYAMADLGRTYMAAARWAEAETYLRNASACAPRLTAVHESLGDLYLQLGKPQEAAAAFRRAEELDPTRQGGARSGSIPVFQPR
jgi:Flp pilus assembly protein TadD